MNQENYTDEDMGFNPQKDELKIPILTHQNIDVFHQDDFTIFYGEDNEEIFRVDTNLSSNVAMQVIGIYKNSFLVGEISGHRKAVNSFHEVLGINKLVAVIEYLKRGY